MDRQIKVVIVILIVNFAIFPFISNYYDYYLPQTHQLMVQENGISNATSWGVSIYSLNGTHETAFGNYTTLGGKLLITLPYGFYSFKTISPPGYQPLSRGQQFFLSGTSHGPKISLGFLKLYPVTFEQRGLNNSALWGVSVHSKWGMQEENSTNSTVTFEEPLGHYLYTATSYSNGSASKTPIFPKSVNTRGESTANVTRQSSTVMLVFTKTLYPVNISVISSYQIDTGNLNGVPIKIGGTTLYSQYSFASSSYAHVQINLPNGTYEYSTSNVTGYRITSSWGYVIVAGAPANFSIIYKYTLNTG